jgi:hypothetical protein
MGARVLVAGQTPAQVCADFAAKGVHISERALRAKARELGACRIFGKAMILLPEHVDLIFEAPECQNTGLNSTSGAKLGGSGGALKARSDTTARALELLTKKSQGERSRTSKPKLAIVHS